MSQINVKFSNLFNSVTSGPSFITTTEVHFDGTLILIKLSGLAHPTSYVRPYQQSSGDGYLARRPMQDRLATSTLWVFPVAQPCPHSSSQSQTV